MSGVSFATKGSAGGPAAQTVWFGAVTDRLNMLMPYNFSYNASYNTSIVPAHYGNLWPPQNASFTTFTTAPDGTTNTAQMLVEDTSNNQHFIQAGTFKGGNAGISSGATAGRLRMAAYLKQATRTRVGFSIQTFDGGGGNVLTLTVVFDLAGGQVGVPASVAGGGGSNNGIIIATGTQIIPASQGFYLCIQDFYFRDGGLGVLLAEIFLDAGSGTGAIQQTYTGNGSGAYIWRTNCMPAAAHSINQQTFFDDFTSLATVDLNNTLAPGFNWYVSGGVWTNYSSNSNPVWPPSQFSQSGSIITLKHGETHGGGAMMLASAAQINAAAGTYAGRGLVDLSRPALVEALMACTSPLKQDNGVPAIFWSSSLEWIVAQGQGQSAALASQTNFPGCEFDFVQVTGPGGVGTPANTVVSTQTQTYLGISGQFGHTPDTNGNAQNQQGQSTFGQAGIEPWQSTWDYGTNVYGGTDPGPVINNGVVYLSTKTQATNINNPPPNATYWSVAPFAAANYQQATVATDITQMHLYTSIILPFYGQAGISAQTAQQNSTTTATVDPSVGGRFTFYDGALVNLCGYWGQNLNTFFNNITQGTFLSNTEGGHLAVWLDAGNIQDLQIDYVRIMQ